jgi:hypothetical protein
MGIATGYMESEIPAAIGKYNSYAGNTAQVLLIIIQFRAVLH